MDQTITYVTTAADDRHSTALEVAADGRAHLRVGSNRDQRARAIGLFEAPLPPELLQRLFRAIADPAFAAAATQASLVPDEAYRRIQVGGAGTPLDKVVGEQIAAAPAFLNAERAIAEAIAHTMRHPLDALAMRLGPLPPVLRQGTRIQLDILLAHIGHKTLRLPSPRQWGLQGTAATLGLLRADVAPAELRSEHQRFIALGAANFSAAEPAPVGEALLLSANGRVRLAFALSIDWAVGRHRVELDLEAAVATEDGRPLFDGALFTEPTVVEVRPA